MCLSMPRACNRMRAGQEKEQNEPSAIYPHNQVLSKLGFFLFFLCKLEM